MNVAVREAKFLGKSQIISLCVRTQSKCVHTHFYEIDCGEKNFSERMVRKKPISGGRIIFFITQEGCPDQLKAYCPREKWSNPWLANGFLVLKKGSYQTSPQRRSHLEQDWKLITWFSIGLLYRIFLNGCEYSRTACMIH
jgi:hypothetical protein